MKHKLRSLAFLLCSTFFVFAQQQADSLKYGSDKVLCNENLSIYTEFYKQKNYTDAYQPWSYLFNNTPKRTKNIYIHGPRILRDLIKNELDTVRKSVLVDSLLLVYDQRNKYYPGQEAYVNGLKGADIYKQKKQTVDGLEEARACLSSSFDEAGYESSSSVLNYYFLATTKLVQAKQLNVEDLINLYSDLLRVISYRQAKLGSEIYKLTNKEGDPTTKKEKKIIEKDEKELKTLEDVKNNLYKTVGPHATCDKLVQLYTENFERYKEDIQWLERAAKLLYKKQCTDTEIFFKISEALYNIHPSPFAAYKMGVSALKKEKYDKALEFLTFAYENEEDDIYKSKYVFKVAQTHAKLGQNRNARKFALLAAKYRSAWGEPYLLIGDLYAQSSRKCGELKTEFLKRVGYWAAIDKYEFAAKIDKSVLEKAEKRIVKYTEQIPSKTDIFTEGLLGVPTYQIECWYSEMVSVRVPN